ncbi:MAG: hypothetical protein ACRD2R_08335 [Terriglobales bacterium]
MPGNGTIGGGRSCEFKFKTGSDLTDPDQSWSSVERRASKVTVSFPGHDNDALANELKNTGQITLTLRKQLVDVNFDIS